MRSTRPTSFAAWHRRLPTGSILELVPRVASANNLGPAAISLTRAAELAGENPRQAHAYPETAELDHFPGNPGRGEPIPRYKSLHRVVPRRVFSQSEAEAMLKIAPRVRLFGAWIAVLLSATGCVDPKCPSGYDEKGDTCYRRKDAGLDGATMEVASDDETIDDASFPVLGPDVDGAEMDGGTEPDIDTGGEAPKQKDASASVGHESGMQPRPDDASSAVDPCKPNPCQNGGTCTGDASRFSCACTGHYAGATCEQEICGDTVIRSRADVDANRQCAEIHGTLDISSVGLVEIAATDFPYLSKIGGDLLINGLHTGDAPFLESVTLAKLRVIEGNVVVTPEAAGGGGTLIAAKGPVSELHLPALMSIGSKNVGDQQQYALSVGGGSLKVLDLPALTTVRGGVILFNLLEFCTVDLGSVSAISGNVQLKLLPKVSAKQLGSIRAAAVGNVEQSGLGCCWPSISDQVLCDTFQSDARAAFCDGC